MAAVSSTRCYDSAGVNELDPSGGDPTQIGQYEVTGRIGRGSFGVVFRGRDPYLKRDVAIKLCTVDDEKLRQRFHREAEIAGRLEHDHVVAVHAFGFHDEQAPYLVQEFLEGEDLSHLIEQRVAWTGRRKLDILAQVAEALAYAHEQGVIHRDVKPANVRVLAVEPEARIKLMDFGIAKLAHDESQLTQKGVTMGTASYLPPEQVKGGEVDHRGDIFSFGVLAYELFSLERPFRGQTLSALVYQILYKSPTALEDLWPGCPRDLSQIVHRCLQKDPNDRYGEFREVLADLEVIREGAAVGRWPELDKAWLPEDPKAKQTAAPEEKAGLRSANGSESVAEAAGSSPAGGVGRVTQVMGPDDVPGRDLDATQPVSGSDARDSGRSDAARATVASDDRATDRLPLPDAVSEGGSSARDGAGEVPEELRTSAHEISKLVEKGELEAAMQQLEQTIHRHRGLDQAASITGVLPQPTEEQVAADLASKPASPPPIPGAAARPPDPQIQRSHTSTTGLPRRGVGAPVGKILIAAGFVLAALLAIGMGWWLGRERSAKSSPPPSETPPAATAAGPPTTGVVVQSTPWALVSEITDADGYVVDLPEQVATPFYMPLPPGEYTVTVRYPEGNTEQRCQVAVTPQESALCVTPFTQPTASDYFKDAGWWR